ncbi:MAG: UbiX family flavin prenyltransferase [Armatimonadetes bacterium]|nr:UbiX family flavin prenyltransferase [Armatimonadota bacterium]
MPDPARPAPRRLVLAVSGASGSGYAALFLQQAVRLVPEVAVVLSEVAPQVIRLELGVPDEDEVTAETLLQGVPVPPGHRLTQYRLDDYRAPFASGSNAYDAVVICPCSQGLLGHIAHGVGESLITRAADVCLKERRLLIVVPRETPLGVVHLRNMTTLAELGAVVLPAMPSFYHRPQSVREVMLSVVDRILAHLGLERSGTFRWGEEEA